MMAPLSPKQIIFHTQLHEIGILSYSTFINPHQLVSQKIFRHLLLQIECVCCGDGGEYVKPCLLLPKPYCTPYHRQTH